MKEDQFNLQMYGTSMTNIFLPKSKQKYQQQRKNSCTLCLSGALVLQGIFLLWCLHLEIFFLASWHFFSLLNWLYLVIIKENCTETSKTRRAIWVILQIKKFLMHCAFCYYFHVVCIKYLVVLVFGLFQHRCSYVILRQGRAKYQLSTKKRVIRILVELTQPTSQHEITKSISKSKRFGKNLKSIRKFDILDNVQYVDSSKFH